MEDKPIKQYLKKLEIEFKTYKHEPIYTCEEGEKLRNLKGMHAKSLFLKSKKSKKDRGFYMVIIPCKEKLDMRQLGIRLGEKLTFANQEEISGVLHVKRGAVSPFSLIQDNSKVRLIIDKKVWDSDIVNFHPNINTETLELKGKDFQIYIKSLKNELMIF